MRPKITVIGAGNVGREVAAWCAIKELGDIVLWNRTKEIAIGNALDLMESAPIVGFDANIKGTGDLKDTKNSEVIVVTAGLPRKPGMTREQLVQTNANILFPLVKRLAKLSPNAIIVMVTNPLDAMTYTALKASRFPKSRVIGMAGILDGSRFEAFIAKTLHVSIKKVSALVIGSHGENMVPLPRFATVGGVPLEKLMSKGRIGMLVRHTKKAGLEIVNLLKANASFSVGAATAKIVESIIKDKNETLPCSVYLQGEYGLKDLFIGVPCVIGRKGLKKIIELRLNGEETRELHAAAKRIKKMIDSLNIK